MLTAWPEEQILDLIEKAEYAFLSHESLYSWDDMIAGTKVPLGSKERKLPTFSGNTYRGFHRLDKSQGGASRVFREYFRKQKDRLINEILAIESEADLNASQSRVAMQIKTLLVNIKPFQLESFNKVRKPIDLLFTNLISMTYELRKCRGNLAPYLYLPLDSQMLSSPFVFSDEELKACDLTRHSTYASVREAPIYYSLQALAAERANMIGKLIGRPFYRIYFDLLWGDRFKRPRGNLFELNL